MFNRLRRLLRIGVDPLEDQEEVVLAAIESAVERTDPRIRLLGGYQKKLRVAVAHGLGYASEIVMRVPGPIEVSSKTFGLDPRVHAFFFSVDQLRRVFSLSRDARRFFEAPENRERDECYGLLVMDKRERNILGAELRGHLIQKDVHQVCVSFVEHRVLASSPTLTDLERAVTARVFKDLIACAVERILSAHVQRRVLEDRHSRLKLQLRLLEARSGGLEDALETMELRDEENMAALRRQLASVEQELRGHRETTASFSTLERYLDQINEVLNHPDVYFRLRQESINLNRLGIKTAGQSSGASAEIPFAAVELGDSLRCVSVLVKFTRGDMQPVDYYLKKALLT